MQKPWKVSSCLRCQKARPLEEKRIKYTYCRSCLKETELGPYRPFIEDPGNTDYDRW